jgi:hypothetical protein
MDALPGGRDRLGPRPGCLDLRRCRRPPRTSRAAACIRRSVLGSALARSPSRASSFRGQQDLPGHRRGQPCGIDLIGEGREVAQAGVLAGANGVLGPGADPVTGVDVGVLAQPAFRPGRPVRDPAGSTASRLRPPARSAARRDAAPRGARRSASPRASRPADPRPIPRGAARSAR